ncbi:MAG: SpoIIE family protein phosphatase [Salinivirgaceae bacterium]|jgi:serine phosphatase RsbU (regulator of sigma subunit)/ligand-binding sensor domain-containing protein|nr:SpoIIE family protein phosphatase [Salinivirgaceae bacterium]
MNNALITLFLLLFAIAGNAQINKNGYPFYRYYGMNEYGGTEQNWAIVKDKRGILYFGNNDAGVLQYDGKQWRKIPTTNNSIVRSLAISDDGHIFVGAVSEFGHLIPDNTGSLRYQSLLYLIDSSQANSFRDVWKTVATDRYVYFCSSKKVFRYDSDTIKVFTLPKNSNFSFGVDNELFVANYNAGILKMTENGEFEPVASEVLAEKNVSTLAPISDTSFVVGTFFNGLYKVEKSDYSIQQCQVEQTNAYLKTNVLYQASIHNNTSAYATLNGGVFVTKDFQPYELYNSQTGLPSDERVAYVYSNNGMKTPLWAGLNNGIMRIDWHLPFRVMDERNGLKGHVLDIQRFNGDLYLATSSGLFVKQPGANHTEFKNLLSQQAWSLLPYQNPVTKENVLLIGTTNGLYELTENGKIRSIEERIGNIDKGGKYYIYSLSVPNPEKPGQVFIGTREGLSIIEPLSNKWHQIANISKSTQVKSVVYHNNKYWFATSFSGIANFSTIEDEPHFYAESKGVNNPAQNYFHMHNQKLYMIGSSGILLYNAESDKFEKVEKFKEIIESTKMGISYIEEDEDYFYFNMYSQNRQCIKRVKKDGTFTQYDTTIYNRLPNVQVDVIYAEKDLVWLGSSKGLFSFNKNWEEEIPNTEFKCYVRKVTLGNDSILFGGDFFNEQQVSEQKEKVGGVALKHKMNDIRFTYAAAFYENEEETRYSYKLDGYDKQWSSWSLKAEKEYTNLPSGKYRFQVKARNIYGMESKVTDFNMHVENETGIYDFKVLPPWYQTIWAILGYIIGFIILVILLVQWRTRKLQKEKEHLEELVKQRTAEIVEKKEEIEKQRDEIADKNKSITDSIQYASRIQQALLPSKKMLDDAVPEHFVLFKPRDIVSGDYYWMTHIEQKTIIVAADCTGHGVPGAFMSMLGMSFFNEIVNKNFVTDAGEILNHLRAHVIEALKQEGDDVKAKDGMDLALYVIDNQTKTINFAGANNPLYIIRKQTPDEKEAIANEDETKLPKRAVFNQTHILEEVKADKMPIGIHIKNASFQTKTIKIDTAMQLYTFSDGYVDQFGGPSRRKFMSKAFKKLLMEIHEKNMQEQKEILDKRIMEWIKEGEETQVDDIVVLGVKIS